jgi:ubiquinone/menaquinone biosynthesis C-methylase UbiE
MLPRVLEPEVMDSADEAHDYDAMDHRQVNEKFVTDFFLFWAGGADVLDVGTGTAQIPIALCRRAPGVSVVAVDAAQHMLTVAQENVARARLTERIRLQHCDAKGLPFPDASFSAVISNSIVHHIPKPENVLAEMVRVVKPNGALFVRDLMRPTSTAELVRLLDLYAGDANDHQRKMFAESLHAALTLDEIRDLVATLAFPPNTVQATSDRHWTWAAVRPHRLQ